MSESSAPRQHNKRLRPRDSALITTTPGEEKHYDIRFYDDDDEIEVEPDPAALTLPIVHCKHESAIFKYYLNRSIYHVMFNFSILSISIGSFSKDILYRSRASQIFQ